MASGLLKLTHTIASIKNISTLTFLGDPCTPGDPTFFRSGVFCTEVIPETGGGAAPCCRYCCCRSRNCCSSSATTSRSRALAPTCGTFWPCESSDNPRSPTAHLSDHGPGDDVCVVVVGVDAVHVLVQDGHLLLVVPASRTASIGRQLLLLSYIREVQLK